MIWQKANMDSVDGSAHVSVGIVKSYMVRLYLEARAKAVVVFRKN